MKHPPAALLVAMLLASPASAREGGVDFARGEMLAAVVCSECHDVSVDQSDDHANKVPSFYAIANKPNQSTENLTENIIFPHRDMPPFSFDSPSDLQNIIGYIMSMRGAK